jgi:hypothetical protein
MMLHRLTPRESAWALAALAAGYGWVRVDQAFLPPQARMPVFFVVAFVLMVGLFAFIRPAQPWALAGTLAVVLGGATLALIVVQHVLVTFDPTPKLALILGGVVAAPFPAAAVSGLIRR